MKIQQATFLTAICLTLLTACSFQGREPSGPGTDASSKTADSAEADGRLSFALDAFRDAIDEASENENVVVSPLGIYRILGALSLGTDETTKTQIDAALGRTESDEEWTTKTSELYRALEADPEIALAGGLWIQNGLTIEDSYLEKLGALSDQEARNVDFSADAAKSINDWFKAKTDGKVADLIGEISPDARLFLADAVQFKGEWARAFDPNETRKSYFKGLGDDAKDVRIPSMWIKSAFPYRAGDGFQYLELPYRDGRYSMVVLLPDVGRYAEFEKNLSAANLEKWRNEAKETEVRVLLPKFAVDRKTELKNVLNKLGIVDAFGDAANFKPMVGDVELKLGSVVQGAFLKIDERGTEAAAGTGATLVLKSAPDQTPKFYADRPFLYFVRRDADSQIVFCGRFVDPSAALDESENADSPTVDPQDDLGLVGIGGKIE